VEAGVANVGREQPARPAFVRESEVNEGAQCGMASLQGSLMRLPALDSMGRSKYLIPAQVADRASQAGMVGEMFGLYHQLDGHHRRQTTETHAQR